MAWILDYIKLMSFQNNIRTLEHLNSMTYSSLLFMLLFGSFYFFIYFKPQNTLSSLYCMVIIFIYLKIAFFCYSLIFLIHDISSAWKLIFRFFFFRIFIFIESTQCSGNLFLFQFWRFFFFLSIVLKVHVDISFAL